VLSQVLEFGSQHFVAVNFQGIWIDADTSIFKQYLCIQLLSSDNVFVAGYTKNELASVGIGKADYIFCQFKIRSKSFLEVRVEVFPFGDTFLQIRKFHDNRNSPWLCALIVKSYTDTKNPSCYCFWNIRIALFAPMALGRKPGVR
jgi:hypothetical protein